MKLETMNRLYDILSEVLKIKSGWMTLLALVTQVGLVGFAASALSASADSLGAKVLLGGLGSVIGLLGAVFIYGSVAFILAVRRTRSA